MDGEPRSLSREERQSGLLAKEEQNLQYILSEKFSKISC